MASSPPRIAAPSVLPTAEGSNRERLLDAAEECFLSYGVVETTIDDLVRRTGISRATLYRHVGNKEQVIAAVAGRHLNRVLADVLGFLEERPSLGDALIETILYLVDYAQEHELIGALLSPPTASSRLVDLTQETRDGIQQQLIHFVEMLLAGYEATGQVRDGLEPEQAARWLALVTSALVLLPDAAPTRADREAVLRHMLLPAFLAEP